MPANVVSCPSCGKKYKIPADAQAEEFQCTACGATIEIGDPVPQRAGGGGRRSRGGGVRDRRRASHQRQSSNTGLILGLCVVALVAIVVVVGAVIMGGDDEPVEDPADYVQQTPPPPVNQPPRQPTRRTPVEPPPRDEPAPDLRPEPDPEPEPGTEPDEPDPEPEPEPEKTDLRIMGWTQVSQKMGALEHHEKTPAALRSEIDKLIVTLMDFQSGRDGNLAQKRLIEIGKPSVPMLLKAVAPLKFVTIEDRAAAGLVDAALREITRYTRGVPEIKAMMNDPKAYTRVFKYRFIWWERRKDLEGDEFPEPLEEEPPDDD